MRICNDANLIIIGLPTTCTFIEGMKRDDKNRLVFYYIFLYPLLLLGLSGSVNGDSCTKCFDIFYYRVCFFSIQTRRGLARKIDEYVPEMTPMRSVSAKSCVDAPPIK